MVYSIMNLNTISLPWWARSRNQNISVVLPIQGYPKKKLKKGRRRKEGRNKERRWTQSPCSCGCVRDCLWINFTSQEWQQKFRYLTTRIFLLLSFVLVKKIDREQSGKWRVESLLSTPNTTWKKYNLQKSCKRNQNLARYYNSITNLQFQHKPKWYHLSKILI